MRSLNSKDERLMSRCLELAANGLGHVSPNPMVGCVIVNNGKTVGEGYHERFGGPHAEVHALRQAGKRARGATVYVNLEPCSHHGKTPPCVDAIIAAGVRKVVAASRDPNPLVSGSGFKKLRAAGINVRVGVLQKDAEILNEKFYAFMKTRMPFVGLKVAQTLDGYIADVRGKSKWITSEEARTEGHRLRAQYDAILVGAGTVLKDNPELTVRAVRGRNPIRVVLDGRLSVAPSSKVFDARIAPTILFTSVTALQSKRQIVSRLAKRGVQVVALGKTFRLKLKEVLKILASLGISSVLIEGGSTTSGFFLNEGLVRRIHCFIAPKMLGGGRRAVALHSPLPLSKVMQLHRLSVRTIGDDLLVEGML